MSRASSPRLSEKCARSCHYIARAKFQIIFEESPFRPKSPRKGRKRTYPVVRDVRRRALIDDSRIVRSDPVQATVDPGSGQARPSAYNQVQQAGLAVPLAYCVGCYSEALVASIPSKAAFAAFSTTFFHLSVFRYASTASGSIFQCASDTECGTWRPA